MCVSAVSFYAARPDPAVNDMHFRNSSKYRGLMIWLASCIEESAGA
jgi:hypothetical protein